MSLSGQTHLITIYANAASSVPSLQHPPRPPLSRGLEMQSADVSTFPCRLPHRYDSECSLPSPESTRGVGGERGKKKAHMKPILQSVIRDTGLGKQEKHEQERNWFHLFLHLLSHRLSGTRCHLLFSRRARRSIAESDTAQNEVYSRTDALKK